MLINNRFTRHFIKKSAKKCKHCRSDIIENALFNLNGCIYCNVYARLFSLILKASTNSFGLNKDELHDFFSKSELYEVIADFFADQQTKIFHADEGYPWDLSLQKKGKTGCIICLRGHEVSDKYKENIQNLEYGSLW